ncbi:MAG: nodulation protein NfeD [Bacillota bacterium]
MVRKAAVWVILTVLAVALIGLPVEGAAEGAARHVVVLEVEGPIVPVVARYVDRGLQEAAGSGAQACVIRLNTPGGLLETTQRVVERMLASPVPVVVFVAPAGGWAASAGTFITVAADVAAMAPGTRMGAAHPVTPEGELPPDHAKKITEDAAAWARSIAEMRGRDPQRAAEAVTESRSYTDREALRYRLIDLRARDLEDLLRQINGRRVKLAGGRETTLATAGAAVVRVPMRPAEHVLHVIANPNVAYILLSLGMLGLMIEFFHPGVLFPGVAGGLAMLLGLYGMGTLNASWSGILLIILAFGLFIAEIFVTSFGLLTVAGLAALVFGSLMLFTEASPVPQVSLGAIAGVAASILAFVAYAARAVWRGQRRRVVTGAEGLLEARAVALTPLTPHGTVLCEGERWHAVAEEGEIAAGEEVRVTGVEDLRLRVRRSGGP